MILINGVQTGSGVFNPMARRAPSIAGVLTYAVLSLGGKGDIALDWAVGVGMGLGGLAGPNLGIRLQHRLPERTLRRGLGLLALALGVRYALQFLT